MFCFDKTLFKNRLSMFYKSLEPYETPKEIITALIAQVSDLSLSVSKKNKPQQGTSADLPSLLESWDVELPTFANLKLSKIERHNISHTSLAGGVWSISTRADNELFLKCYADAVAVDWLARFYPIRTAKLSSDLKAWKIEQTKLLHPELLEVSDIGRSEFVSSSSNLMTRDYRYEATSSSSDPSSRPLGSSMDLDMASGYSNDSCASFPGTHSSHSHLGSSSQTIPRPPTFTFGKPNFLCMNEIASANVFKMFYDFDCYYASPTFTDDDHALISIFAQVLQGVAKTFYPSMSEEEWDTVGTIAATRTELRPEIKNQDDLEYSWEESLGRLEKNDQATSRMYGMESSTRSVSGIVAKYGSKKAKATDDSTSFTSRLTHSDLWSDSSSSVSSFSATSSTSSKRTSSSDSFIDDIIDMPMGQDDIQPALGSIHTPAYSSFDSFLGPNTAAPPPPSKKSKKKTVPDCAGKFGDYYVDSETAQLAMLQQGRTGRGYRIYKCGFHFYFPNMLVTTDQARLFCEYMSVQITTLVMTRADLLRHSSMLCFGKELVKLSDYSFASTLKYWSETVIDKKVFKDSGPHSRMIFSRKISKCRHCMDLLEGVVSKKRSSEGISKTSAQRTADCKMCGGSGHGDEGPDAVAHGMFAVTGRGKVANSTIALCIDASSKVHESQTERALAMRPITITNFGGDCMTIHTIKNVISPCVRWLPKRAANVHVIASAWIRLTSIRYMPNTSMANGEAMTCHLTRGFQCPPCWCNMMDDRLLKGLAAHNRQDSKLEVHVKDGFRGANTIPDAGDVVSVATLSAAAARYHKPLQLSSSNPCNTESGQHAHRSCHDSLSSVLTFEKLVANAKHSMIKPDKQSNTTIKYGITNGTLRQQLRDIIVAHNPRKWSKLFFAIPTYENIDWELDPTLPKQRYGRDYVHYQGDEKNAIRYKGMSWIIRCSGASVHECMIKGSSHKSSYIYFKITYSKGVSHVIQLCYSDSVSKCSSKFHLVGKLPPSLAKVLFTTVPK